MSLLLKLLDFEEEAIRHTPPGHTVTTEQLSLLVQNCQDTVSRLQEFWGFVAEQMRGAGLPARRVLKACNTVRLFIELSRNLLDDTLGQIRQWGRSTGQPTDEWMTRIDQVSHDLDELEKAVEAISAVAEAPVRFSVDPDTLSRRVQEAQEQGQTELLSDVIDRLRNGWDPATE
jgi:hypothetical protein